MIPFYFASYRTETYQILKIIPYPILYTTMTTYAIIDPLKFKIKIYYLIHLRYYLYPVLIPAYITVNTILAHP